MGERGRDGTDRGCVQSRPATVRALNPRNARRSGSLSLGQEKVIDFGAPVSYLQVFRTGSNTLWLFCRVDNYQWKFAKSTDLRHKLYIAFLNRAYPANKEVLMDMIQTRSAIANLLGYKSWADYNAADKMIANGAHIAQFISELNAAARPIADCHERRSELHRICGA